MSNDLDEPGSKKSGKLSKNILSEASKQFSKIAIVRTDVKRTDFPTYEAYLAERECIERSDLMAEILTEMGVDTTVIPADSHLVKNLQKLKPELCINFVDTLRGSGALASGIPGIFDLLRLPYVGAGTLALSISSNKYLTKTLLEAWDLPTPQYQLFRSPHQQLNYDMRYPLIVKLNEEHGSVGIDQASVVTNDKELKARLQFLIETYNQPALVEEFIENGREITGVVVEAKQTVKVFLSEREFEAPESGFKLVTFDTKWATDLGMQEPVEYISYDEKDENLIRNIKDDLRQAFEVLKMDDLGRFDVILDKYNHYIVDANANPSLGPVSSVARAVAANGQKFTTILLNILQRNKQDIVNSTAKS